MPASFFGVRRLVAAFSWFVGIRLGPEQSADKSAHSKAKRCLPPLAGSASRLPRADPETSRKKCE
jgi:hypothetical protein